MTEFSNKKKDFKTSFKINNPYMTFLLKAIAHQHNTFMELLRILRDAFYHRKNSMVYKTKVNVSNSLLMGSI